MVGILDIFVHILWGLIILYIIGKVWENEDNISKLQDKVDGKLIMKDLQDAKNSAADKP